MGAKRASLWALHRAGMFGVLRHLRRNSLVVLTYHGVMPGDDDRYDFLDANFVAASAFERQIRWVGGHYRFVSLAEVVRALQAEAPLPARAAAVTFDDGFANNFRIAFPILQRYGVPCTFFVTTGKIGVPGAELWTERIKRAIYLTRATTLVPSIAGAPVYHLANPASRERAARAVLGALKRLPVADRDQKITEIEAVCGRPGRDPRSSIRYDFLTWDEIRAMARQGAEFGSHTVTHPILTTISDAELERELLESKRTIEAELQRECRAFAYPNGSAADFGEREKTLLRRLGYRAAFALQGHLNRTPMDPFAVDRVNISREFDPALFNATLTGAMADMRRLKSIRPATPRMLPSIVASTRAR